MSADVQSTGLTKMREAFPDHQISTMCRSTAKENPKGRCNKCGGYHGLPAIQLDYVGHAALTDRLLDCDPNWTWEPLALDAHGLPLLDSVGGMWIKLTVCGITRLGYGDAQNKTGGDAVKERIGDALRNAAMRFGAALELWHKGELHVEPPNEKNDVPAPSRAKDAPKNSREKEVDGDGNEHHIWTEDDKQNLFTYLDELDKLKDSGAITEEKMAEVIAKVEGERADGANPEKVLNRLHSFMAKAAQKAKVSQ